MQDEYKNDKILIKGLKDGDSKAYNFLLNAYHHKLCVYAHGLANDHTLAEDIVQNVFVYVWHNRAKLKDDFLIKNYLYRSVYNEFIDQYRKRKSLLVIEKKYIDALSQFVEEKDENSMEKLIALVKREIEKLPPKCKQSFLLCKQEGLTNIEVAEYLNVSVKSVEAHNTKAFSILRERIGGKMNRFPLLLFITKLT